MSSVNNTTVEQQLAWRYATKQFDAARRISPADWKTLEQSLVLSPSSFGLQPWKFLVVNDPEIRAKLRPVSWNQSQITDASHLVIFAARKNLGAPDIDRYLARIAEVRKVTLESLEGYKGLMAGTLASRSPEAIAAWSARQAYIALGSFLTTAALLGIDTCPIEGFDPSKYDEILGLGKIGYTAVVVAAAGYRSAADAYAHHPKVRYAPEEVVVSI